MTKIAGSGSISQKHGSEDPDPDPPQNVMDPEHCLLGHRKRKEDICLKKAAKFAYHTTNYITSFSSLMHPAQNIKNRFSRLRITEQAEC